MADSKLIINSRTKYGMSKCDTVCSLPANNMRPNLKLSDIALTYPSKSLAIPIKDFGPIVYSMVQTVTKYGIYVKV